MQAVFYNTQHAPVGAWASFTLGGLGAAGGMGLELGEPARENLWIGYEEEDGIFRVLPFFAESEDASLRFAENAKRTETGVACWRPFQAEEIVRELTPCRDIWSAGDMRLSLISRAPRLSDPDLEDSPELRLALVPAILCEIVVDNRRNAKPRLVFWGWEGKDLRAAMRCVDGAQTVGIAQGMCGFFGYEGTWVAAQGFSCLEMVSALARGDSASLRHAIGPVGALVTQIPPGGVATLRLVAAFWRGGEPVINRRYRYLYSRWWDSLETVAAYLLQRAGDYARAARADEESLWNKTVLSHERQWLFAQAVHSYYGSTRLLEDLERGVSIWSVMEGEYRLINTMDLAVDQIFYELNRHPWTTRSVLDQYCRCYKAEDHCGLIFTHDMGIADVYTPCGQSAYEQGHRDACFSFMCHEELVNWILCAIVYARKSNDMDWLLEMQNILGLARQSLLNRDHRDPQYRKGVMQVDSDRCDGGSEITTYDSLDRSLGPARGNMYLAVKTWAAWRALAWNAAYWERFTEAEEMRWQADLAARTINAAWDEDSGVFPAFMDGSCAAVVIPVVEGVIFPWLLEKDLPKQLSAAEQILWERLSVHLKTALLARCRFADGGWKLSESSDHAWLSKIFLAQFIAETIFGLRDPEAMAADRSHMNWLLDPENNFWAFSDQIAAGKVCGSRYYPRGVTACLWTGIR